MKYLKFIVFCGISVSSCLALAQSTERRSIDSLIELFIAKDCFNGDMLITVDDKPFYGRAVGYRSIITKEVLQHNSLFNIGSVSKPLTAIAVLQLQQKKKLNIEDNVRVYIPEFPYDSICIKHLLSHTSGLKQSLEQIEEADLSHRINNDSLVNIFARYKPELFALPGSKWIYSNLGYDILAVIIERVSGMRFEQYMRQHVFLPAGMHNTFVPPTADVQKWLPAGIAAKDLMMPHMYANIGSCTVTEIDSVQQYAQKRDHMVGSGNVYSTVIDLAKLDSALRNNIILSKHLQELAYTPFSLTNGDTAKDMNAPIPSYYGLGWFISIDTSAGRILWHKGRSLGSRSVYLRNPVRRQTVTFNDNYDYAACDLKGIACLKTINHQSYKNPVLISLVNRLGCGIYTRNIDAALSEFRRLKETERYNYYISEEEMTELGNLLAADKRLADALTTFRLAKELYPASPYVLAGYAAALLTADSIGEATDSYKQAVYLAGTTDIEREMFLNSIGYQLILRNRLQDAELVLKLNTELFPESGNVYDSYAAALVRNNKTDLAITNEEKAIQIAKANKDELLETFKENLKKIKEQK